MDYGTRLSAALRARGASDDVVRGALASLHEFPLDEDGLIREFGEPEQYAQDLIPDAKPRARFAFILTGLVLGVVAWIGLRAARDADVAALDPLSSFGALVGLLFIALGVLAEFLRYLAEGRKHSAELK